MNPGLSLWSFAYAFHWRGCSIRHLKSRWLAAGRSEAMCPQYSKSSPEPQSQRSRESRS